MTVAKVVISRSADHQPLYRQAQMMGKRCSAALNFSPRRSAFGGVPMSGHELVDASLGPAVDEPGQQIAKIALRVDGIQLAYVDGPHLARPLAADQPISCDHMSGL